MKKLTCFLLICAMSNAALAGSVAPFTTIFMRTVLDDATSGNARTTLEIVLTEFNPLLFAELSANPNPPAEGKTKIWMSDGTGYGDDGDLIIAAQAGGVTKFAILWDFSAAAIWTAPENVIYAAEDVIFAGEHVVYP